MFGLGVPELILILVVVLLFFGPKKLPELGSFLGSSLKGFREALDSRDEAQGENVAENASPRPKVADAEAVVVEKAGAAESDAEEHGASHPAAGEKRDPPS